MNETISLSVPAAPTYGRIVRAAGANLATRLGWKAVDIDSLRVAIDAALTALVGGGGDDARQLDVTFAIEGGSIKLTIAMDSPLSQPVPDDRCAAFLTATVGRYPLSKLDPKAYNALLHIGPI